eukprot:TRINITY_DN12975_c0_g1_i1.p1 TRINITY_DN12975_c0_g1~~TRINITY_DN12975_c0_g1_i1.p1  ORF type:complete len:530 (+),score=152.76 TRINITY_DN12975_c0_g1_i1:100-1689(+)
MQLKTSLQVAGNTALLAAPTSLRPARNAPRKASTCKSFPEGHAGREPRKRESLVRQLTRSTTLTPSMAQISGQDRTVELRGLPSPPAFDLGGKQGNVVTSSRTSTVHKGWRAVAVDGQHLSAGALGAALAAARQRTRYSVTFRIGEEVEPDSAENAEHLLQEAEEAEREERALEAARLADEAAKEEAERAQREQRALEAARLAAEAAREEAERAEREKRALEAARLAEREAERAEREQRAREAEAAEAERKRQQRHAAFEAKRRAAEEANRLAQEAERRRAEEEAERQAAEERKEAKQREALQAERESVSKRLEQECGLPPRASVEDPQQAMLAALCKPAPVAKRGGPCDKCDGPHHEDDCPFFKGRKRFNHKDALDRYGKKGQKNESSGSEEVVVLKTAKIIPQPGDGSCLFHSLSYGLKSTDASKLRAEIADHIAANPKAEVAGNPIKDWVLWDTGMDVSAYAKTMRTGSRWGGAVELAVCAKLKQVAIHIFEKGPKGFKRISVFGEGKQVVRLHYGGRVHYDALEI